MLQQDLNKCRPPFALHTIQTLHIRIISQRRHTRHALPSSHARVAWPRRLKINPHLSRLDDVGVVALLVGALRSRLSPNSGSTAGSRIHLVLLPRIRTHETRPHFPEQQSKAR